MTPSQDATPIPLPITAPALSGIDESIKLPRRRAQSPGASLASLPDRRSSPSLSSLFASTSSLAGSRPGSGTSTPTASTIPSSVFSPVSRSNGAPFPGPGFEGTEELRNLISRSFAPHVGVLASEDTEELVQQKGFQGGLLDLIRPFGEHITGKLAIRDSNGSSKVVDDFGIRFMGLKDGLGYPSFPRKSAEGVYDSTNRELNSGKPSDRWSRTGGDISHIEEAVGRHIAYAEMQNTGSISDYFNSRNISSAGWEASPFYALYLRRLLSGLPLVPHETFSHPVACVIAISSHSTSPIEELRRLYTSTNISDSRLPQWVNNEFLRYYVLLHDEDNDDIKQSMGLYEQMKRNFGLHCHLLRIRSAQAVPSDDESVRIPLCEWMSASEELAEIEKREAADDDVDPTPCIFESDATAIRSFVRELVASSIVPLMERMCAQWNEQILSRRKGLSGRFMSLSKRWTPFGASSRNSSGPMSGGSSNYDSLQGFYKPDTPEALMRKLADYAFMLRDYKLAQSTYDVLRSDFNSDKAWTYYAGASEMVAIAALMTPNNMSSKARIENIDQFLEASSYSYVTRSAAPYYALRTLALGLELLRLRGSSAADDAARWASRILESRLVGPIGHALFTERVSASYGCRRGVGNLNSGSRTRKSALWALLATSEWIALEKTDLAEKALHRACALYGVLPGAFEDTPVDIKEAEDGVDKLGLPMRAYPLAFGEMKAHIDSLREALSEQRRMADGYDDMAETLMPADDEELEVEDVISESLTVNARPNRKSLIGAQMPFGVDVAPLSPVRTRDEGEEGFTESDKIL
ncbi:hypothetical protein EJ05DRAFT_503976 [Pseudovirgaria hyperparasitica]|uniref:Uncharacterized protein n=1 Tax=Pseudovirgaria hyperparasitica TaxID=470096 RepID=A0A6A6VXS4_9PEZI|nr:uncharacterized protein EJ05DRAFT_503976 [Pseudovirgaria hyperparasitica]KAF2754440.1 hypothetical protein EJ05DRAFT_503976 [Pseudovirgaria hyperparasitica]